MLKVVDAEEVTIKRSVLGYVIWYESRDVVSAPLHDIFNIRKEIYSNIIESILTAPPPESTSFCDLGFLGNM